jgi:hypothetical protein
MLLSKYKKDLSVQGRQVLTVLMSEYNMNEDAAIKLIIEGGFPLAIAIINRKKI